MPFNWTAGQNADGFIAPQSRATTSSQSSLLDRAMGEPNQSQPGQDSEMDVDQDMELYPPTPTKPKAGQVWKTPIKPTSGPNFSEPTDTTIISRGMGSPLRRKPRARLSEDRDCEMTPFKPTYNRCQSQGFNIHFSPATKSPLRLFSAQPGGGWAINKLDEVLQNGNLSSLIPVYEKMQKRVTNLYEEEYNMCGTRMVASNPENTYAPTVSTRNFTHLLSPSNPIEERKSLANCPQRPFRNVTVHDLETSASPHYARESLDYINILKRRDQEFALHLIRTCTLSSFKLPEYKNLTIHDEKKNKEYNFEMQYSFGYTYNDNCKMLAACFEARRKRFSHEERMPIDCSNEIAKMLGNTHFEVLLKVYFDKTKASLADWHEQDGEAWIYHPHQFTNHMVDLVTFDKDERIYYVERWPQTGLLCDEYDRLLPDQAAGQIRNRLERIVITWVCSQITWLAFKQIRNCHSKKVRNRLSKLLFVLKGWYTGLLLGESFEPDDMSRIVEQPNPHVVA